MSTPNPRDPVPIELVRPSFYAMLVLYYCGLTTYGAFAIAFASPSLVLAAGGGRSGDQFAFVWSILVTAASACAVAGVVISRRLEVGWIEFTCAVLLISLLTGYTVALVLRGLTVPGSQAAIPIAVFPICLCVLPTWRLFVMALDGSVIFKRVARRKRAEVESHYR